MRLVKIKPRKKHSRVFSRRKIFIISLALALSVFGTINYFRPLPDLNVTIKANEVAAESEPNLDWPARGSAAISAKGFEKMLTHGDPYPISTASIAKVITVLCVLEKHPLKLGELGPILTITAEDVERYHKEVERGGSKLAITEGEKISQYKVIEAIMLPSANNMADTLAVWAFGSLDKYRLFANEFLSKNGMKDTVIGPDASGFDPSTKSTAKDLATLARIAIDNPVVMKIAGEKSADFETAGTVNNRNTGLGSGVLTGLKTGNNDGNSGSLLFTATTIVENEPVDFLGVTLDTGSLSAAISAADILVKSAVDDIRSVTYAKKGDVVGKVSSAWGAEGNIVTDRDISIKHWRGSKVFHSEELNKKIDVDDKEIGSMTYTVDGRKSTAKLIVSAPMTRPGFFWRLFRLR